MRRLLLLRHGKSDWSAGDRPDLQRPLAPRGREAAKRVGVYITKHGLTPEFVICSTAARARDTYELVAEALTNEPKVAYDKTIYESGPNELLAALKKVDTNIHTLLIVGHNPSMTEFAHLLIAAGDVDLRQSLIEKFPTAGLAVIDFPLDDWRRVHPRSGRLDRFITPRLLEATTD